MIFYLCIVSLLAFSFLNLILTCVIVLVPVKYEQVVFCGLSEFQLALYQLFIVLPEIRALLHSQNSQPLKAINILKNYATIQNYCSKLE